MEETGESKDERLKSEIKRVSALVTVRIKEGPAAVVVAQRSEFFD